jgi:hypothetical protein
MWWGFHPHHGSGYLVYSHYYCLHALRELTVSILLLIPVNQQGSTADSLKRPISRPQYETRRVLRGEDRLYLTHLVAGEEIYVNLD